MVVEDVLDGADVGEQEAIILRERIRMRMRMRMRIKTTDIEKGLKLEDRAKLSHLFLFYIASVDV